MPRYWSLPVVRRYELSLSGRVVGEDLVRLAVVPVPILERAFVAFRRRTSDIPPMVRQRERAASVAVARSGSPAPSLRMLVGPPGIEPGTVGL